MSRLIALSLVAGLALAACDKPRAPVVDPVLDRDIPVLKLNDAIQRRMGGPTTCVVLADAETGQVRYQYGMPSVCMRELPPCATVQIADALIGLDADFVTPETVFKWDGKSQKASVWQHDADMTTAFATSNPWWFERLAGQVGARARGEGLKALGYSEENGQVVISTREQAQLLQQLHLGRLPVKPETSAAVEAMMQNGKAASCDTAPDGSRTVGWYLGHAASPKRNLIVAASIEGDRALPGKEMQDRLSAAFSEAGLTQ